MYVCDRLATVVANPQSSCLTCRLIERGVLALVYLALGSNFSQPANRWNSPSLFLLCWCIIELTKETAALLEQFRDINVGEERERKKE